jgi:hypothetical protein
MTHEIVDVKEEGPLCESCRFESRTASATVGTGLMCGNSVLGTAQVTSNWATTCHMCKFLCQGRYIGVPKNLKISHDDHYFCDHSDVDINVIT